MTNLILFKPRWHGRARWHIEHRMPATNDSYMIEILETGWTRRRRGAPYVEARITNHEITKEDA